MFLKTEYRWNRWRPENWRNDRKIIMNTGAPNTKIWKKNSTDYSRFRVKNPKVYSEYSEKHSRIWGKNPEEYSRSMSRHIAGLSEINLKL